MAGTRHGQWGPAWLEGTSVCEGVNVLRDEQQTELCAALLGAGGGREQGAVMQPQGPSLGWSIPEPLGIAAGGAMRHTGRRRMLHCPHGTHQHGRARQLPAPRQRIPIQELVADFTGACKCHDAVCNGWQEETMAGRCESCTVPLGSRERARLKSPLELCHRPLP